jgi:hypothetical protein
MSFCKMTRYRTLGYGLLTCSSSRTLCDCGDGNWSGLPSLCFILQIRRKLSLSQALAEPQELQELGFEICFHFREDFEPHCGKG